MLVVIGVVLFSEVSKAFVGSDPSRIAAQIVTGIGFLGAGSILRTNGEVRGLTTAASIWVASAVGMAVSVGGAYQTLAILTTALVLVTLVVISWVERRMYPHTHSRELLIVLENRESIEPAIHLLMNEGLEVHSTRTTADSPRTSIILGLSGPITKAVPILSTAPGVCEARWVD